MRKRLFAVFAFAATLTMALAGSSAEAQVFVGAGGPVSLTPGYGSYNSAYVPPAYVAPYSYYVLPASAPSRIYVGPDVYPFYGRPYGHPYDRWTWPYISGGPDANLARYYYPPLGF